MADQPQAEIRIGANDGPLRTALRGLLDHMGSFSRDASSSIERINTPLSLLRDRFVAFTAIIGGGALFGKAIEETAKFTETSIQLSKAMGVNASGASIWIAALEDAGASTDELAGASRGLLKNLNENEKGLNAMGLSTRDAAGHLRPMNDLMVDAIKLTNDFTAGSDRQLAARQIWGKSVDASSNLLKINGDTLRENAELMRDLGMVVTQENVAAYEAFDNASDRSNLVMKAFTTTVGNALMPVLTKLGEWFVSIGPAAVVVLRGAVGGLVSIFWGLKTSVTIAWETINAMVVSVAEPVRALGESLYKLVTGDFKGAAEALTGVPKVIAKAWSGAWDEMVAGATEARDRMGELFLPGTEGAAPSGGTRRATTKPEKQEKAPALATSYMQYYEAVLAEDKRVQSMLDGGREYSKAQELAYWRELSTGLQLTANDRLAISRKTAQLEIDISRKATDTRMAIDADMARSAAALALSKLDAEAAGAQAAYEAGVITKGQLAQLEAEYEERRYGIQAAALQERLALLALDPTLNPVEMARIKNELVLLEQEHQKRMAEVTRPDQSGGAMGEVFGSLEDSSRNAFNGMIMQAQSWRSALTGIYRSVAGTFVDELISKPLAAWIANQARMTALTIVGNQARSAADWWGAAQSVAATAWAAVKNIAAKAWEVAASVYSALAGIPYIGPFIAPVAAIAAGAVVLSYVGKIASAEGGYNIPKGANPLTQLHEEEMVLPSPLANAVRRMAGEDGEGGGAPASGAAAPQLNVHPLPGGFWGAQQTEFVRFFKTLQRDRAFG